MSVGPMNSLLYSVAGSPLAQTTGADLVRARADALAQQRTLEAEIQTEDASGIGKTDGEDNQTNERDGDGRTPWRFGRQEPALPKEETVEDLPLLPTVADESDGPGGHIDLSG